MSSSTIYPAPNGKFSKSDFAKSIGEKYEIHWAIERKDLDPIYIKPGKFLCSPTFPDDPNANSKWMLSFYPRGNKPNKTEFAHIYLHCLWKKNKIPIFAFGRFSVKAQSSVNFTCERNFTFNGSDAYGIETLIKSPHSCIVGDVLTICVKISTHHEFDSSTTCIMEEKLFKNYDGLLNDDTFSDIILCTKRDGQEFKVHRCILASKSNVFAAMLHYEMKENLTGRIVIDDFSSSTIREMISFLYTYKVTFQNVESAFELLAASEKYELMELKDQCGEYLLRNMDENNVCDILLQAHIYNSSELKSSAMKYMCDNSEKFSDISKLQALLKGKSELLIEVIAKFAQEMSKYGINE